MPGQHHRERRTTKLGANLFNKLGPLCEYTRMLRRTEWTEPLHLVHKMEVRYCISCNGWHWWIVELVEYDPKDYLVDWNKYDVSEIWEFVDLGIFQDTKSR